MATTLKAVEDNTAPAYIITCERDGTAIDLTGATVTIIISNGTTITNAAAATSLITPASGIISYTPSAGDFPAAGTYKGDVKVVYSGGAIEILYEQVKWKIRAKIT